MVASTASSSSLARRAPARATRPSTTASPATTPTPRSKPPKPPSKAARPKRPTRPRRRRPPQSRSRPTAEHGSSRWGSQWVAVSAMSSLAARDPERLRGAEERRQADVADGRKRCGKLLEALVDGVLAHDPPDGAGEAERDDLGAG